MDLRTRYLGFQLPHPLIAGASPLADSLDSVRRLEDAGASAIVLRSLFEEQLAVEGLAHHHAMDTHAESYGEAASYFPTPPQFALGPDDYLDHLRRVKEAVDIPVIASLNGISPGGWEYYAKLLQVSGADALELNFFYIPTEPNETGAQVEERLIRIVQGVRTEISIPIAVKLSPFYTAFVNLADRLTRAGVRGIVLFNRFYEPDIDFDSLDWTHDLQLSTSAELPLRLRWLALLSGRVNCDLSITGGVHRVEDVAKSLMCGATTVQIVSAALRGGAHVFRTLQSELTRWLEANEYHSLDQIRGSMNATRCPDPQSLTRGNYMHMLQTWRAK